MNAVSYAVGRALAGQHVPELPAFARVNIARLRERALTELPAAFRRARAEGKGPAELEQIWADAVNRIFDEAGEALRLAQESDHGD